VTFFFRGWNPEAGDVRKEAGVYFYSLLISAVVSNNSFREKKFFESKEMNCI
jgi:hypothetical protein